MCVCVCACVHGREREAEIGRTPQTVTKLGAEAIQFISNPHSLFLKDQPAIICVL
jgi:hypothetical protein